MNRHHLMRRRDDRGFTLVELLVVIVILGILSAVVVFAVRGSGDKGKAAAVATDNRTIRTALEAFCATNDHYPGDGDPGGPDPMNVLVTGKFLSSPSKYHELKTGDALLEGKCGTARRYSLIPLRGTNGPTGPPGWAVTNAPQRGVLEKNPANMVRLQDGRIFTGAEVYDPKATGDPWKLAAHTVQWSKDYPGGEAANANDKCFGVEECGCPSPQGKRGVCRYGSPGTMVPSTYIRPGCPLAGALWGMRIWGRPLAEPGYSVVL